MTTSRSSSDPFAIASALVLVAACLVVAGVLAWAGLSVERPCSAACGCAEGVR